MDLAFFRQHSLTRGLNSSQIQRLTSHLEELRVDQGERVMIEGAETRGLFLIKEGDVVVKKGDGVLAELAAPTVFGELELVSREPASASIEASTPLTAYLLSHEAFERLVDDGDAVVSKMMRNIARVVIARLADTNARMVSLMDERLKDSD